jgi:competence protein ComGC
MLKKQRGFGVLEIAIIFLIVFAWISFIVWNVTSSNNIAEKEKAVLQDKGYSLIKTYSSLVSNKEYPDVSNCQDGEFIFVTQLYRETDNLGDASGAMCKLKE